MLAKLVTVTSWSVLKSLLGGPFGRFAAARLVSLTGSAMTPVALSLAVLQASGRTTDLAVVLAAQVIPHLSLLLLGGALGDRWPRWTLLVGANLGAGLTQGAVAVVLLTGHYHLVLVACLELVNGATEALASPALRGIVPELVDTTQLPQANAVLATAKNLTKVLGPATAGVLVVAAGGGVAIAVDAVSFLAAAMILAGLRLTSAPRDAPRVGVIADIRQGWLTFRTTPWLWATTASFAAINLIGTGTWQILGPALTTAQSGAAVWGIALSARAVGALMMGALLYRHVPVHLLRAGQLLATLGASGLLALGLGASAPWFVICVFVSGLGFAAPSIAWDTCIHQHIPRHELSRISAYSDLLSYTCVPIGQLLVSPAAAWCGQNTVALGSAIGFAAAALAPLTNRAVCELTFSPSTTSP